MAFEVRLFQLTDATLSYLVVSRGSHVSETYQHDLAEQLLCPATLSIWICCTTCRENPGQDAGKESSK